MRYICLLFSISLLLSACGSEQKTKTDSAHKDSTAALKKDPRTIGGEKNANQVAIDAAMASMGNDSRLGCWVGMFGNNMINLTITKIEKDSVKGHSVCAGNFREVNGTVSSSDGQTTRFVLNEPGNDPYDGKFEFEINTASSQLSGKWIPFKAKGNTEKTYTLKRREFKYLTNTGDHPETSERLLKHTEVENLNADQLAMLRCEIYARHGYSFKDKKMRGIFEKKEWYMPMGVDIRDKLTDTEARNIDLIYRYEDYYNETYGDYGR